MNDVSKFIVDTNTFITPYKSYYAPDLHPEVWEGFKNAIIDCKIIILDLVKVELLDGNDWLSEWINQFDVSLILSRNDLRIINKYTEVLEYLSNSGYYTENALIEWSDETKADAWLIAAAAVNNYELITLEKPNNNLSNINKTKRAKIPDVCYHFGVKWGDIYYLRRQLGI
ncbi:MAG: DUF4411 family protein [Bacilli bacterium]